MQTTRIINENGIGDVLASVYKEEKPVAYQVYSEYGEDLKIFYSKEGLTQEVGRLIHEMQPSFQFALHYPESLHVPRRRKAGYERCDYPRARGK